MEFFMSDRMNNFINNSIISGACIGGIYALINVGPGAVVPFAFIGGTFAGAVVIGASVVLVIVFTKLMNVLRSLFLVLLVKFQHRSQHHHKLNRKHPQQNRSR